MNDPPRTVAALQAFAERVLRKAGLDPHEADSVAGALVWCDATGRRTQGLWRLPVLARRIRAGGIVSPCRPRTTRVTDSVAALDGNGGAGHHLARLATLEACELAKHAGIGLVTVSNSNFCGALAYYSALGADAGLITIVASNSYPKVAAFGGLRPVIGTNPLAVGIPLSAGRHFLLDMATSASAGSTVRKAAEAGAVLGAPIAIDATGEPSADPAVVESGALLPFGGAKGFGLGLVVEILAGVLSGAAFGDQLRSVYKHLDVPGGNGQLVLAIDVARLMPITDFFARLDRLQGLVERSGRPGATAPRLPGAGTWAAYDAALRDGIVLDDATVRSLRELAEAYDDTYD